MTTQTKGFAGWLPRGVLPTSLLSTSIWVFVFLCLGAGITSLSQLATARLIGPANFGDYAFVVAWVAVLGYLSTLGFHISLLKLMPAYMAKDEYAFVAGALRFSMMSTVALGVVIAAIGIAVVVSVTSYDSDLRMAFILGLACVPLFGLRLTMSAAIRAFGGMIRSMIPERILRDGIAVVILAFIVFAGLGTRSATTATVALLAGACVTVWVSFHYLRETTPAQLAEHLPRRDLSGWLRPVFALSTLTLADTVMAKVGILILGMLGDTMAAGIFSVAMGLAVLANMPRMAIARLFAPTVARHYALGQTDALQDLTVRASLMSLVGTTALVIPLIAGAPYILGWFGPGFEQGETAVVILLLGYLLSSANGPQQHLITMTGQEAAAAKLQSLAAVLNVGLTLPLALVYGLDGAAIGASASLVVWNVAMAYFVHARLGIMPGILGIARLLKSRVGRQQP